MKPNIIIPIILITLLSACNNHAEKAAEPEQNTANANVENEVILSPVQAKNSDILIGEPQTRLMHTELKVSGVVDVPPKNIVSISIPLGGYLKKMALIPGQKVKQGEVLATMEDPQYIDLQQDFLTAKSRLEYLQADFDRQRTLNQTKSTSDKIFQQAKADFESQKVLVRSLGEKLRLLGISPDLLSESSISRSIQVYSPISGYVTKVNVNTGKYVTPSDVLFELINPADLHIRLTVFENDASNLVIGQKITCATNNRPDEKYTASIHLITPNISENRATEVHCHLEGNHKKLFPGTFVNASIELNNANVLSVPEDAVVKWEDKNYLFSQIGTNHFRLLPVETGSSSDGFIEIKSPIPGGSIVVKNAYTLLMKLKNSAEEE